MSYTLLFFPVEHQQIIVREGRTSLLSEPYLLYWTGLAARARRLSCSLRSANLPVSFGHPQTEIHNAGEHYGHCLIHGLLKYLAIV